MSIKVENLKYVYNEGLPHESVAIDDMTFEIPDGIVCGIIGHTGSGKSTLVQHLNGLIRPKSGHIIVDGTDITEKGVLMRDIRRKVGLVFQYPEYQLFEETVRKDVSFGPKNLGLSEEEIEERAKEAVELVGLDYEAIKDKSPFDLSGGQKRRVAIAGVVAMKPEVLILDEPTAGLDPEAHKDIITMMNNIHEHEHNTTIMVSHNMEDVAKNCDMVLVIDRGKIVLSGTPREVFAEGERLKSLGLGVPPAADVLMELKKNGLDISTNVFDAEEAAEHILEGLNR